MQNQIKFLIILYLFALISKPSLTEDMETIATNLEKKLSTTNMENQMSTTNLKDGPMEESLVIKKITITYEVTDSLTTEISSKSTHKKQKIRRIGDQINIVGGFDAQLGWYPYQVALFTKSEDLGSFYCGGSIISNVYVLTAAHCTVHKDKVKVVGGIISVDNFGSTAQVRYSRYIIVHEKYDHEFGDSVHDISLILVDTPFRFNKYVKSIYLATRPPDIGSTCIVSGWGYTDTQHTILKSTLKALFIPIRSPNICRRWYKHFMEGMICSGFNKGQDFCFGDSGGPLVCDNEQHGVVSFFLTETGDLCATGGPQVYSKVYYYKPWIDYHMNLRSYRKDDDISASAKSESNSIRPQLFLISVIIVLSTF